MNVFQSTILTVLLCEAAYSQTAAVTDAASHNVTAPIVTVTNATEPLKCTTTWRFPGKCVFRTLCDNNTPAIDLTPYAPRGPKRVCPKGEVCCPLDLIVSPSPPPPEQHESEQKLDFDDDD